VRVEGWGYDHNFYLPIPFAEHARITYECDSLTMKYEREGVPVPGGYWWPDVFYNICYREYTPGTRVRTFTVEELKEAGTSLSKSVEALLDVPSFDQAGRKFDQRVLPDDSLTMEFNGENSSVKTFPSG
jgi:hypothetical protein